MEVEILIDIASLLLAAFALGFTAGVVTIEMAIRLKDRKK